MRLVGLVCTRRLCGEVRGLGRRFPGGEARLNMEVAEIRAQREEQAFRDLGGLRELRVEADRATSTGLGSVPAHANQSR
jgi:hypothetical protein